MDRDEEVYLLTNRDGFLVRVPASRLEAFQRAQAQPKDRPLSKAEQQVKNEIVYGFRADQKLYDELSTPEVNTLEERYHELYGVWTGYRVRDFGSVEEYKDYLRKRIAEKEKELGL